MRKLRMSIIGLWIAGSVSAAGIPAQITYQGTLKDKGAPAAGTKTMRFRITDNVNGPVVWTSPPTAVSVSNGLFSVQLTPSGVDWQNVKPYLEVEINGQTLSPSEAIGANVYAMMSESIVDGAVTPSKVAIGYGLVPSKGIMIFESSCPPGWSAFAGLQGKFPVGADPVNTAFTIGKSGGSETHAHSLSVTSSGPAGGAAAIGSVRGDASHGIAAFGGPGGFTADFRSADTNSQNNLPPYLTIVFCQKQ